MSGFSSRFIVTCATIFPLTIFLLAMVVLANLTNEVTAANRLVETAKQNKFSYKGETVWPRSFRRLYKSALARALWIEQKGFGDLQKAFSPEGKMLIKLLKSADDEGLDPADYIAAIPKNLSGMDQKELAQLELYLSQSFLRFARHLHMGKVSVKHLPEGIYRPAKQFDPAETLNTARHKGLERALGPYRPTHKQYLALKKLLSKTKNRSRRQKIALNMERWRWLAEDLGETHILVNQPAYRVYLFRGDRQLDERKVIIGKPKYASPQFSDTLEYVEFNPNWTVPASIAVKEYLPRLRRNRNHLKKLGYALYESWAGDAAEIDSTKIDWKKLKIEIPEDFPYRIVQGEGEQNALGQVKFMFPNALDIYLHDTPAKNLFKKKARAFSHGCIRVHEPLDFAKKIFQIDQAISPGQIPAILKTGQTQKISLKSPITIHLAYFTVWVDAAGKAHYYDDVYGRDKSLMNHI